MVAGLSVDTAVGRPDGTTRPDRRVRHTALRVTGPHEVRPHQVDTKVPVPTGDTTDEVDPTTVVTVGLADPRRRTGLAAMGLIVRRLAEKVVAETGAVHATMAFPLLRT